MTAARELPFLVGGGEMGRRIAEHDWSSSPIGPVRTWPAALRAAVGIALGSRHPMLVWCGPELVLVYNDAFMALAGSKHPAALGAPGAAVFPEIWPTVGPRLHALLGGAPATWMEDQRLVLDRQGFPEETYWTCSSSRIRGEDGTVLGVLTATGDTTERVVGARRLHTLRALGDVSAVRMPSADEVAVAVLEALSGDPADLPFAALCLAEDPAATDGERALRVAASYGIAMDAPLLGTAADRDDALRRALHTGEQVLLTGLRAHAAQTTPGPDTAIVLPLAAGGDAPQGALVLGTSPHRPLDDDYRSFLHLVGQQVAAAIRDAGAVTAARRHSAALAEQTDDIIGRHDVHGTWLWASPSLLRVAGHAPADVVGTDPARLLHPDDRETFTAALLGLSRAAPSTQLTVRFRHADGHDRWFELSLRRVRDDRSGTVEVLSSARDITDRLFAEEELSRFRVLAERFGSFIAFAAADGSIIYINPAGRRLIGAPEVGPLPPLALADVVAPGARDRFTAEALPDSERTGSWSGSVDFLDRAGTRIPVRQSLVAHRDVRGRLAFFSTVAEDLRERQRADRALFDERERYRTLVAQAPVGIWVADRRGATTFVNDQVAALWGRGARDLAGAAWIERVHPEDRAATAETWTTAVRDGTAWEHAYRLEAVDGSLRHVRTSARPLRGADGALTGFLGTTIDVTDERHAEEVRRDVATEHAARQVSDAAAARLRAMVQGLAAIVWEAEWDPLRCALRFTFVSDRAEELLGHPARDWREDPDFWPQVVHPEDRDRTLEYTAERSAAGHDHDITYRAVAVDGRVVWLHQVVHVVRGPDGRPQRLQGLTVDVTEQKRAERSAALLAETGRLVTVEGTAEERLAALARLVVHDLGDVAVVSMAGPDGRFRRAAVAHDDPDVERALLGLAPTQLTPSLTAAFAPGLPVLVPITDELNRACAEDDADAAARVRLGASNSLVVPLRIADRVVGLLGFLNLGGPRYYQPSELDLAAELGRRASLMLAADRQRTREQQLRQMSAGLASAGSVAEAARLLVARLTDALGAAAIAVHLVEQDRGIRLVHAVGHPGPQPGAAPVLRFDDQEPVAAAVRTGEPVWIHDRAQWASDWPDVADRAAGDRHVAATLPLTSAGRVVGTVAMTFTSERKFPTDEREFALALVAQAAPAFERAATADERRLIAETLQTSLLPPTLPRLDRLILASRYLPGAHGTQAGGDWYDVLPVDDGLVAIAVGDVVGQGAKAAAIMGQLRSALSGYLLEGHDPVQALERLDRFAGRVPGAAGSTVACLVLDPETGELTWARAGHPPPIVTGPAGARLLQGAMGTVLAVQGRPPFTAGVARISPGDSIVLYTDGLVERRGEIVDEGIGRLAGAATRHQAVTPVALTDALLAGALGSGPDGAATTPDPADDVAIIVARLVPAPLRLTLPARPTVLRELRAAVVAWAAAVGLDQDDSYDLQLAVGEAAANAVEHAYRDRPAGVVAIELVHHADGAVRTRVRDEGSWRPAPDDRGFRGRGLELIREVSTSMELDRGPGGTEVRFTLSPSRTRSAAAPARARPEVPAGPATVQVAGEPRDVCVTVGGDLDLAGVQAVRDALVGAVRGCAGAVTIDLRATTYLASAGIALLAELDRVARTSGARVRLLVTGADVVRRALALGGVDRVLEVLDRPVS